jgi:hypothetical protein
LPHAQGSEPPSVFSGKQGREADGKAKEGQNAGMSGDRQERGETGGERSESGFHGKRIV